ncbi:MAG: murein hydrolase activator EnvC family protein [Solirubrobacterales bacterium]
MPSALTQSRSSHSRLVAAPIVLATCLAIALAAGPSTHAQTDSARLDSVRAQQDQIRGDLAEQNAAVDSLIGEVSALRQREEQVAGELAKQEAELTAARQDLADARNALAETKHQLHGALADLRRLLVSVYRFGQIDTVTVLLDSDGFDQLTTTATYLDRIRDYESRVVSRVRDLRDAASAHVAEVESAIARMEAARAAIAARQRALAGSRASLEQREAELQAAQAERRDQLAKLQGKEKDLVQALSTPAPAPQPGNEESAPAAPAQPVAPPGGSQAALNSDGTATAPADAPQAVKDAIAAANAITNTPYVWGGGHGSFESSGYDCSGSVSFALHGGGFLSSPLDSTGLMTWGDAGPGNWITVYANPGHAYMVVAGLRFDTSGAPPRWQTEPRDPAGYVARHPAGY